jgi:hypothetical protein
MSRKAMGALLAVGALAFAPTAAAQPDLRSGNFWLAQCRGDNPSTLCLGFLSGFIEMNWVLQASNDNPLWCPPEGVTLEQVRKVILSHMDSRPQKLHEPFPMLAASALRRSFPYAARGF